MQTYTKSQDEFTVRSSINLLSPFYGFNFSLSIEKKILESIIDKK